MQYPHIKLTMPNGPSMGGARIEVDGVEQRGVRSVEFSGEAGKVGRLTLNYIAALEIEGGAEVVRVHLCPECKARLDRGVHDSTDITEVGDEWQRVMPVGDVMTVRIEADTSQAVASIEALEARLKPLIELLEKAKC